MVDGQLLDCHEGFGFVREEVALCVSDSVVLYILGVVCDSGVMGQ